MGASLLRLHFHDCFVNGCDGSILLDGEGREKSSVRNAGSLRGFDVIDQMKAIAEEMCPGVVSCADLLTFAAEKSVVTLGGPSWPVIFGRRDSTGSASASTATADLPSADANIRDLISLFARKGFTPREMIALSGAHTIGQARCELFRNRIYDEPNIDIPFAMGLQHICPNTPGVGNNNLAPLDFSSSDQFNNDYFSNLINFQGLLHSDQVLFSANGQYNSVILEYVNDQQLFFTDFSNAMLKMSKIGVLTGRNGIVRQNCRFLN